MADATQPRRDDEEQERLDQLGRDIEATRRRAVDDGLLPETDPDEAKPSLADPDPEQAGDDELPPDAAG